VTEASLIETCEWSGFERRVVPGATGPLSLRLGNAAGAETVLFNHSILTGSAIWHRQAQRLVADGWRVICLDTRGHGGSAAPPAPYTMDDLVADNIAALDALGIAKVHYVGVSQGGMTGFGLGIQHAGRIASLCIVAARADAPRPFAAAWDDRIALVRAKGIDALAGRPPSDGSATTSWIAIRRLQPNCSPAFARPRPKVLSAARRRSRD
jgi:3-oxoadipate enol-lactonase